MDKENLPIVENCIIRMENVGEEDIFEKKPLCHGSSWNNRLIHSLYVHTDCTVVHHGKVGFTTCYGYGILDQAMSIIYLYAHENMLNSLKNTSILHQTLALSLYA